MNKTVTIILGVLVAILVLAGVILYPEYTKQKQAIQACEKKLADIEKKGPALSEAQLKSACELLVSSLNDQIKKQEITIKEFQGGISLSLVDRILFRLGEATLTPQGQKVLAKVGEGLKKIEGKMIQVGQAAEILGFEPDFVQAAAVERDQMIDPLHHGLEPAQLQGLKLFPGQGFVILISDHGKSDSLKAE